MTFQTTWLPQQPLHLCRCSQKSSLGPCNCPHERGRCARWWDPSGVSSSACSGHGKPRGIHDAGQANNHYTPYYSTAYPWPTSSGMCTTLLGGYWGVLGPNFLTVGPKRRPGAQNGARPQPGLCQGGRNVGYKSACHVLETARDGSRRRPDSASCSPPLKQATSRSKPRKIEAARTT